MALFHNEELFEKIGVQIADANKKMKDVLICEPFTEEIEDSAILSVLK